MMVGSLLKLTYNCSLDNTGVAFLFLAVVALLEQIQCSGFFIFVFVSLETTNMKARGHHTQFLHGCNSLHEPMVMNISHDNAHPQPHV